jgi:hypothetical protein
MRKIILLFVILASISQGFAQDEVQLQLDDTLYFAPIATDNYVYIDYYKKTRFEKDKIDFDTCYNQNFYNLFFGDGDFDVSRMPKRLANSYGIIKYIMAGKDAAGNDVNVIIAMIENGVSAAYIMEDAFIHEEVWYAQKQ